MKFAKNIKKSCLKTNSPIERTNILLTDIKNFFILKHEKKEAPSLPPTQFIYH